MILKRAAAKVQYCICLVLIRIVFSNQASADDNINRLLSKCTVYDNNFDHCMQNVLNELTVYFRTGVPDYNILPFDPHHASFIELRRGDDKGVGGFQLILRNISEYGWSRSIVTKYHTDIDQNRIVYSQYFPEKSLDGWYEFKGSVLGAFVKRKGFWNMTLNDYSQTTSVRRLGGPASILKVQIQIDKIGGLQMHVSNIFAEGQNGLNNFADGVINTMWPLGLPFIKPLINELISSAFTDIFNESFRYFPVERFLRYV